MKELTVDNVRDVIRKCEYDFENQKNSHRTLFSGQKNVQTDLKKVVSDLNTYYFSNQELENNRDIIEAFLRQLDWSKKNLLTSRKMSENKKGQRWGNSYNVEDLLALGMGLDLLEIATPLEIRRYFPNKSPIIILNKGNFKTPAERKSTDEAEFSMR